METLTKNIKEPDVHYYDPQLDKMKVENYFPEKLSKAKIYFEKHGLPDFDKILKEAEEKEK